MSSVLLRRGFVANLFRPTRLLSSATSYNTDSTNGAGAETRDETKYTNFGKACMCVCVRVCVCLCVLPRIHIFNKSPALARPCCPAA